MRKYLQPAIAIVALVGVGAALHAVRNYAAGQRAEEVWSTKKVMDKAFLGKQSLLAALSKDVHNAEPDWKAEEQKLAEIIRLMSTLTKQKPPRGSQKAWDKQVQDFVDKAKDMHENVKAQNLRPARAALEKLRETCDECHDNHGIQ